MTCGVRTPRPPRPRLQEGLESADIPADQGAAASEVFGTWDFAWPLGTTIRVAFQALPDPHRQDLEGAMGKFMLRVNEWRKLLEDTGAEIDFEVQTEWVLDPPLGEARSKTDRNRSSFDPDEALRRPYDILVSFMDLPVVDVDPLSLDRRNQDGLTKRLVRLPYSELGSYARRVDYGVPTMYIGRFGRFAKEPVPLATYMDSPIGRHVILHELGHALGLAHSHQNPFWSDRARKYRDFGEISEIMTRTLGVDFEPAFGVRTDAKAEAEELIRGHIISPWRGNPEFSYWKAPAEPDAIERLDSVMKVPFHGCFLAGHKPCAQCRQVEREKAFGLPDSEGSDGIVTEPRQVEKDDLTRIYCP